MVYETICGWYCKQPQIAGNVALVLHTSCINYALDDLQMLSGLPFPWLLPGNVQFELRLLTDSKIPNMASRAAFILSHAAKTCSFFGAKILENWDLEQFYRACREPIRQEGIFSGKLLFVFGDLGKQDEFLGHCAGLDSHFIFFHEEWSCVSGLARICQVWEVCRHTVRKTKELCEGDPMPAAESLLDIQIPGSGLVFNGKDLSKTGQYGSYAWIYTYRNLPGKYIKIYKNRDLTGNAQIKLRNLARIASKVRHSGVALPEEILYNAKGHVLGYTMKCLYGRPIRDFLAIGWDGHDLTAIFRRLSLLLLELHTMHMIANDLSFNNILVGDSDGVGIVDCDSFQVFDFPGGGITELYRHPEICAGKCNSTLREPRHEYFSFASILFQCLFYCEPLCQMQEEGDERVLGWDNALFQLDVDGKSLPRANRDMLRLWEGQPRQIQKMFADVFHFRRDHSIGAWIRALGLLDESHSYEYRKKG